MSRFRGLLAGSAEFVGWGPAEFISADIADLIHAGIYAQAGKRMPSTARYPRPAPQNPMEPKTIAEFNPDMFMKQLNK